MISGLTKHGAILTEQGPDVKSQFLRVLGGRSRDSVEAGGQVWQILSLETRLEVVEAGGQVSYIWLGKRANPLHFDTLINF